MKNCNVTIKFWVQECKHDPCCSSDVKKIIVEQKNILDRDYVICKTVCAICDRVTENIGRLKISQKHSKKKDQKNEKL